MAALGVGPKPIPRKQLTAERLVQAIHTTVTDQAMRQSTFENLSLLQALWLFPVAVMLHELEEWNIMEWYQRNFVNVLPMSNKAAHRGLVFVGLSSLLWTAVSVALGNPTITVCAMLFHITGFFQNALQHIYWSFYFRQYAPGVITSVLLLVPISSYLATRAVLEHLAPVWYLIVLLIWIVPGLIRTVKARNQFQTRGIHWLIMRLSKR